MDFDFLADFQDYLLDNNIAHKRHVPYWAYWVKLYIDSVKDLKTINNKESKLNFFQSLSKNEDIEEWQIKQAKLAIDAYLDSQTESISSKNIARQIKDPTKTINAIKTAIRLRHYSYMTEKTYIDWIKKFNRYLGEKKNISIENSIIDVNLVKGYLEWLAIKQKVSASTQNQAFNALLFLMKNILKVDTKGFDKTIRAKKTQKIPVVLSIDEIKELLENTNEKSKLMIELLYGTGMRLSELTRLRIKDLDFDNSTIVVKSGKGDKDRTVPMPSRLKIDLRLKIAECKKMHTHDLSKGYGEVNLPHALARKYKNSGHSFAWQYLFPSHKMSVDPLSGKVMRYHISNEYIQKAVRQASKQANIIKHVTVHTLRHSFATHLLQSGVNIREIQDLLGHKNLETTMIYTHVLRNMANAPKSPLDSLYKD